MAILSTLSIILMALMQIESGMSKDTGDQQQPLNTAIEEMQKANYFAFVMLLNMAPLDKIPGGNITFLMPNNRKLAKAVILRNHDVLDFLLRHSIPSALGFEYLNHLPTGSIIPSSDPNFMLKVSNNGRRSFFLNNVRLISPNICVAGSSIRCHGIDGVLQDMGQSPPLPNINPSPSPVPTGGDSLGLVPAAATQPTNSDLGPKRNSGSSCSANSGRSLLGYLSQWVLLLILWCYA